MKSTFGIFTKSLRNVVFGNMRASVVEGQENPNHPNHEKSPNAPRVDRFAGYRNPELGDAGKGKIGRWQQLNLDALETVIDQIIEQYLRDRAWYSKVRCREALWNMYRRLEWWVKQQVDPSKNDYQRALQMIRDCINRILEEAQDPELAHNTSLPLCPAPYYHPYHGDYFNHYDGKEVELELFNSKDLPISSSFPGFFRYVSSTEDQEWEIVHSVGDDESLGTETIMKLQLDRLLYGNSSKITFNWRFKRRGRITFSYMASTAAGNGLAFFINNNQVGGEWNQNAGWQTATFNVSPGQTYKFDWLIRRQTEVPWGKDAVYIKDVSCIEVIRSLEDPTPPDFDTLGSAAYNDSRFDWITYSKSSVIRTHFDGVVNEGNRTRTLSFDMDNECDGVISFAYKMGVATPGLLVENNIMYDDDLLSRTQTGTGRHGSSANKNHDGSWQGDRNSLQTKVDSGKITYELVIGGESTVDAKGLLEIICPDRVIDHYEPAVVLTTESANWFAGGLWRATGNGAAREYLLENPIAGSSDLSTNVSLSDDGWFTFSYMHSLRPSETLEVLVDDEIAYVSNGARNDSVNIPLAAGSHIITFRILDQYTEQPISASLRKTYTYGLSTVTGVPYTTVGPMGSKAVITRNWKTTNIGAETFNNGSTIDHVVTLNPGATFSLDEIVGFLPNPNQPLSSYYQVFNDNFNDKDAGTQVNFTQSWNWEDILVRQNAGHGDGVYKVEGVPGEHTATINVSVGSGGYVTFEFGGKFGRYDYFDLIAGGTVIWSSNKALGIEGQSVQIPIPAGNYPLTWKYYCAEGTVTIPPDTSTDPNPNGELCYPGGQQKTPVEYSSPSGSQTLPRSARIGWGGSKFFTSSSSNGAESNGATITREYQQPLFDTMSFSETLTIYAGRDTVVKGQYPVEAQINKWYWNDYYILPVSAGTPGYPGFADGWKTETFYSGGRVDVSFEYLAYMVDSKTLYHTNHNKAGVSAAHRGEFVVYLVNEYTNEKILITQEIENYGIRQGVSSITNWSDAKHVKVPNKVEPGNYYVQFLIYDRVTDNNMDNEGFAYYAALRDLKITVTGEQVNSGYDNTQVKVELIDMSNGSIAQSRTYSTGGQASKEIRVVFGGYPAEKTYRVRYTLIRGTGTTGGLYGNGGSFKLTNGAFYESWIPYCKSNGKYYPKSDSNQTPPDPGQTVEVPVTPGAWCWLDAITVMGSQTSICQDTYVDLIVRAGDDVISSTRYGNLTSVEEMTAAITNTTASVKIYTVSQVFHSSCGDGVRVHGGEISILDSLPVAYSFARISGFSVTNNAAIWMGGCDGSSVTVTLTDEAGNVKSSNTYSGGGLHAFGVSDLQNQPYSKYSLQIETNQQGEISPVTGKSYMTTFKLLDFKAFERWENIPDPFNGKLEFFIDNVLTGTYEDPGGFFEVSDPLPKGKHNLKWVFTELGNGNSYDICEIDYLKLTNWICDKVKVVPYCDSGGGDVCVEELIKCLLGIWNNRPKACVIGKRVWIFT